MQHYFELYILSDKLTTDDWNRLYQAVNGYSGKLNKFEIIFSCTDNIVRFFIGSNRDLSGLSNNIAGVVLRPIEHDQINIPNTTAKERGLGIQFVTGGNLLDFKEKYGVKGGKDLQFAVFRVRSLVADKAAVKADFYFHHPSGHWGKIIKSMYLFPAQLFAIDFATNTHYLKKSIPKYLDLEKSMNILVSDQQSALFEVDTFPYFSHNYYLNLNSYEFDRHSFIVGASGSGKSKFIGLFIDRLSRGAMKMNYRVIVIDPHASIAADLEHIKNSKIVNFSNESTELFSGSESDITAATELTATLFKSLLAEQFNPKLDRTLRFSLFVLFTAQNMHLDNLKRFLTDVELRNQILDHVSGYVPANIVKFFGADFNEMRTKYYNEAISPLISLVDEMQLQPTLVKEGDISLNKTIQEHFLTVFSLNKVSMGEKVVKTVAGLLIQQIFLLAQARAFGQKVILIIDEVSVIQNPALAQILAEARKFNLSVILTQQYFGQVDKDLRDAIFANVFNYYAFKVSEEDARALEGNLNIELPKELVEEEHSKGLKEEDIRVKIMTELHPRECLVRVLANGQVVPCIKARTVDVPHANAPTAKAQDLETYKKAKLPTKFDENAARPAPQQITMDPAPAAPPAAEPNTHQSNRAGRASAFVLAHTGNDQPLPPNKDKRSFNLSDLLSQQSSSRFKINRRKEKVWTPNKPKPH